MGAGEQELRLTPQGADATCFVTLRGGEIACCREPGREKTGQVRPDMGRILDDKAVRNWRAGLLLVLAQSNP
jgi:hypothetical protein